MDPLQEWDDDVVDLLDRRKDVLDALSTPRQKRDLLSEVDASRSTLDRAVRELEALDLVDRDGGYHRTLTGHLVVELFESFRDDLDDVGAARELLRTLPPDAPMSLAMLRGVRVEMADGPSPTAVLDPVFELFQRADRMRMFSVAMSRPDYADDIRSTVLDGDLTVECVYTREIVEFARENREGFATVLEDGPVEPYVIQDLPYALRLATLPDGDRRVAVTVYDDWTPRGVLLNDSTAACDWAEAVFERYREAAEPLEP